MAGLSLLNSLSKALYNQTYGSHNTAVGFQALFNNSGLDIGIDGTHNSGLGYRAGYSFEDKGENNTAIGAGALGSETTGDGGENTAIGADALKSNTGGNANTAIGSNVLSRITNGGINIALGEAKPEDRYLGAGSARTGDSSDNIDIGNVGVAGEHFKIRIGTKDRHTATFIAGIHTVGTGHLTVPVLIASDGQLGTQSSSSRFKKEIKPMDNTSETILALKPVTFRYKRSMPSALYNSASSPRT